MGGLAAQQLGQSELPTPYSARNLNLRFTHLNLEDGLSQSSVFDILQDRHGYMWFGTEEGLNRYDGFNVDVFYHIPFDSTSLKDTRLHSLLEDRGGFLWIGGRDLVSRMDPVNETFERFEMPPTHVAGPHWVGDVTDMTEDRDGVIWGGTAGRGLLRLNPDEERPFTFFVPDSTQAGIPAEITSVFEDSKGDLWIKSPRRLSRMDRERTGRFTQFDFGDVSQAGMYRTTSIYESPAEEGILWVGTYDGLVRFDTETGEFQRFRVEGDPSVARRVGAIVEDPTVRGVLWVALDDGIARFDIETGRFTRYRPDRANPASLSTGPVTTLEADRQGLLWIGTRWSGVDRFNPGAVGFELVGSRPGGRGVFENHSVRPIHLTRDNVLLVGSGRPGEPERSLLTLLDRKTGRVERYPIDRSSSEGVRRVEAVFEDASGSIWIGGNGIARFDRAAGRFEHIAHDSADPDHSVPEWVKRIIQDRRGFLWISGSSLSRMDPSEPGIVETFDHDPNDIETLPAGGYIDVAEDVSGYLWVTSTLGGLARLDPTTGKVRRYAHDPGDPTTVASNRVWDVLVPEHEPGVIWASGSGLSRLDVDKGTFRNYTVGDGLPAQNVYGALEDEQGRIWMSTNKGISRLDPKTESFRNYGMEAGLQSLEFNGESLHKAYTGEMFFGGINGLNAFFPNALIESSSPPEPRIVGIRIGDVPVQQVPQLEINSVVPDLKELTLDYSQKDITLDFNAFHYQNPARNEFEYKLEGFNDDWIRAGHRRSASFTNLEPGNYTFELRAANSDGVWSEEKATLRVTVLPPWWRTWWAYLLYALIFAAGVFAIDRVQRSRLLKKERERAREKELEHAHQIEAAYNELRLTQDRLIQSEKMASLGQLTAGIAHEIKNPLNFVNNFSDLSSELADELAEHLEARRDDIPDDLAEEIESIVTGLKTNVEKIHEHGKRADSIVYGMLQHSRAGSAEREETDINALVDEHLNLAYHGMRARTPDFNATMETKYDPSVGSIEVVPQDLGRVLLNLIGNAFDALHEFGSNGREPTVNVSTERADGQVVIRVQDNGPGIPAEVRDRIFEPFFTTKPTGSGTGLGLSMSYDIVTKGHGGELEVVSEPGEGATFIVRLPL